MSSLSTSINSIQDIMRKDVGVDGDAQRIGQLVWLLFLKIWDDREQEIELLEPGFVSPLVDVTWTDVAGETRRTNDLRWRTWAADPEGDTGDKLLLWVNDTLFAALKGLQPGARSNDPAVELLRQRRTLVKSVFDDAYQYMKSGTLLRQVVNKVQVCNVNYFWLFVTLDDHLLLDVSVRMLRGSSTSIRQPQEPDVRWVSSPSRRGRRRAGRSEGPRMVGRRCHGHAHRPLPRLWCLFPADPQPIRSLARRPSVLRCRGAAAVARSPLLL